MAMNSTPWVLTTYTPNAATDLVGVAALVKTVIIVNTDPANAIDLAVIHGAATLLSTVVPAATSWKLDVDNLAVSATAKLQINAGAAGLHFSASGAAIT